MELLLILCLVGVVVYVFRRRISVTGGVGKPIRYEKPGNRPKPTPSPPKKAVRHDVHLTIHKEGGLNDRQL